MGFAEAIRVCFGRYFTFSGRATRPEYWWFALFLFLGSLGTSLLDTLMFGSAVLVDTPTRIGATAQSNGPLAALFALGTFMPALAAGWRRMHDSGRSGLYLLYPLLVMVGIGSLTGLALGLGSAGPDPLIGALTGIAGLVLMLAFVVLAISPLLVIWWLTRPSDPRPNTYGPNPHEVRP